MMYAYNLTAPLHGSFEFQCKYYGRILFKTLPAVVVVSKGQNKLFKTKDLIVLAKLVF